MVGLLYFFGCKIRKPIKEILLHNSKLTKMDFLRTTKVKDIEFSPKGNGLLIYEKNDKIIEVIKVYVFAYLLEEGEFS